MLKPSYKFPQDYPKIGDIITVAGKFEMYQEGEEIFCRLGDADLM